MARISIYVPDDLKKRMDGAGDAINWSEVVRPALNSALASYEHRKGQNMETAVERLRASRLKEAANDEEQGKIAGREWAQNRATHRELRRLWKATVDAPPEKPCEVIWRIVDPDNEMNRRELLEYLTGGDPASLDESDDWFAGFIQGATDFYEEVADKL